MTASTPCTPFLWIYTERNGEWCLPTVLLSITLLWTCGYMHGFDYKLLPFTILGAIYHLWDLWDHFLSQAFPCLVTVKQHSTSPCTYFIQISVQQREQECRYSFEWFLVFSKRNGLIKSNLIFKSFIYILYFFIDLYSILCYIDLRVGCMEHFLKDSAWSHLA